MPRTEKNPTPYLSNPRRDEKIWTYCENRLLDQITLEVMQAWRSDLTLIRKCHSECKKLISNTNDIANKVTDQRELFEEMIEQRLIGINKYLTSMEFNIRLERVFVEMKELNKKIDSLVTHPISTKKPSIFKRIFRCKAH